MTGRTASGRACRVSPDLALAERPVSRRARPRTGPLTILLVTAAMAAGTLAPSARADGRATTRTEPVRSGTVLNPANYTGPSSCGAAPDCVAWLGSRCDARLAGVDPAAFASIVDVRALAGSRRHIEAEGAFGRWMSGATYEFWSQDCRRVGYVLVDVAPHDGPECRRSTSSQWRCDVTVPRTAAWMTVPGSTGPYQWALW